MNGISWPDLTFRPVNLWTVHAAWKLSKPATTVHASAVRDAPKAKTENHAARMIAAISKWN